MSGECLILPAGPAAILHVIRHVRAIPDGIELAALPRHYGLSPESVAATFMALERLAVISRVFAAADTHRPAAYLVVHEMVRGVGGVTLLATDDFPAIARPVSWWLKRTAIPRLAHDLRRAEVRALDNAASIAWLKWLGAVVETRLPDYGPGGETFVQLSWRRSDHVRVPEVPEAA